MDVAKQTVRSQRSKAIGAKGSRVIPTSKRVKPGSSSRPGSAINGYTNRTHGETLDLDSRMTPEIDDENRELAKAVEDRRSSYVKKQLEAMRNKKLRAGKGHMTKSEIAKHRKQLRAEAQLKFTTDNVKLQSASAKPPNGRLSLSSKNWSFDAKTDAIDQSTPDRLAAQKKAREQARKFLGSKKIQQQLHFDNTVSEEESECEETSTVHEDDDAFWKAEEAKWKAELDARRAEGRDTQQGISESKPLSPIGTAASPEEEESTSAEDICLRSQVVVKSPEDTGLGIRLHTPENEQGVRITGIDPYGPFGRTGAFKDGDVIVEIDGVPLLYGGHSAVLEAISEAMQTCSEMVVTVCSATELVKLEALVDVVEDESIDQVADSGSSSKKPSTPQWKQTWRKAIGMIERSIEKSIKPKATWWHSEKKSAKAGSAQTTPVDPVSGAQMDKATAEKDEICSEPAYLIYRAEIRDLEAYRTEYMCTTTKLIQKYGGKWLARGGKVEALEGDETILQRMVLIQFPSMEAAKSFFRSTEYQEARQARLTIATAELTVLEGMRPSGV